MLQNKSFNLQNSKIQEKRKSCEKNCVKLFENLSKLK